MAFFGFSVPAFVHPPWGGARSRVAPFELESLIALSGSAALGPDGPTSYKAPELTEEISYALTQVVPADGTGALAMGFDRHDR